MVIEVRFFKKNKKMKNMDKMWKSFFRYYVYLTSYYVLPIFVYWLFFYMLSAVISLKMNQLEIESEMNNILIYGFQWG